MAGKTYTRKQVEETKGSKRNAVFVIDNLVYDATPFLDEHPGGHEVLLNVAGADASEDFSDIGHSLDAKELMKKYVLGEIVDEEKVHKQKRQVTWDSSGDAAPEGFLSSWKVPLVLGVLATLLYSLLFG